MTKRPTANAQIKMKALVVSRLMLGDFRNWQAFANEREFAGKIFNRDIARNVSSQIGRNYRDLSRETQKFIDANFLRCEYTLFTR